MAGKAKHDKSKRHLQSKKSRARLRATTTAGQEPAAVTGAPPVKQKPAVAPAPPPAPEAAVPKPEQARYSYITAELKRIVILAGGILAILIILALVLK